MSDAHARPRGLWDLFKAFTRLSLMGFGGVLPIAQRELVERLGWLTAAEFAELLSVGQVLPGPNVVNLSLMVGDRWFGLRGALAAVAGMLVVPTALVLALAALYQGFADQPAVVGAVRGMGAVSAGLIFAMGLKLLPTLARNPLGRWLWVPLTALTLLLVGVLRWPLVAVLPLVGLIGVGLAWWRLGRGGTA
jgi:chromate transporter